MIDPQTARDLKTFFEVLTIGSATALAALLVAGIIYLIRNKENGMQDIRLVQAYVTSPAGQTEIADMVERIRDAVGSREKWKAAILATNDEALAFGTDKEMELEARFEEYMEWMFPGHDIGHGRRDGINGEIIAADYQGIHPSERLVGRKGAWLHDVGTAFVYRYADKKNNAPHPSVSAYIFGKVAEGMFSETLMALIQYAIAAHQHNTGPVKSAFPTERTLEVFWDDLWVDPDDKMIYGAGIRITRMADRGDTNSITQAFRHILSRCDGRQEEGFDLADPFTWVNAGGNALKAVLIPTMGKYEGTPTTLQHVTNYVASYRNFTWPYASQDHVCPAFGALCHFKFQQWDQALAAVKDFNIRPFTVDEIKNAMRHVSGAKTELFEQAWSVFMAEWDQLTDEQQATWGRIFHVMSDDYARLMAYYLDVTAGSPHEFAVRRTVAKLLNQ